jgi:predicted oxidoreductase
MGVAQGWTPSRVTAEDRAKGRAAIRAAFDAGYRLFDHADIYCTNVCEEIHGEVLRESPAMRREIVIASKCGIRFGGEPHPDSPGRYDFSADHIAAACDRTLRALGIETLDLYQLHRPDVLMDPDEVAGAFTRLHQAGKVRFFGVSNFLPSQVDALRSRLPLPLHVNQVEIHPGRIACFTDGTLDQCLALKLTPLAWSPLGGGHYGGAETPDGNPILQALDGAARRLGASRAATTLAWLMRHPAGIVPLVGTTNVNRIREAAKADALAMDREDWYRIFIAARGAPMP